MNIHLKKWAHIGVPVILEFLFFWWIFFWTVKKLKKSFTQQLWLNTDYTLDGSISENREELRKELWRNVIKHPFRASFRKVFQIQWYISFLSNLMTPTPASNPNPVYHIFSFKSHPIIALIISYLSNWVVNVVLHKWI